MSILEYIGISGSPPVGGMFLQVTGGCCSGYAGHADLDKTAVGQPAAHNAYFVPSINEEPFI